MATKSAPPEASTSSATSGSMRPTVMMGTSTWGRSWAAKGTSRPGSWGVWASVTPRAAPASVAALTLSACAPAATARRATPNRSSGVSPPARNRSTALSRHHRAIDGPTAPRTARSTSNSNRDRFSRDPPQWSSRWFMAGDRKLSIR